MIRVPRVGEVGEIPTLTRNRVLDRIFRTSESEYSSGADITQQSSRSTAPENVLPDSSWHSVRRAPCASTHSCEVHE